MTFWGSSLTPEQEAEIRGGVTQLPPLLVDTLRVHQALSSDAANLVLISLCDFWAHSSLWPQHIIRWIGRHIL